MDRSKKVAQSFLNSSEGYFAKKRILEERVIRKERYPESQTKGWEYKDIRDINKTDLDKILIASLNNIDNELYHILPEAALNASLGFTIGSLFDGAYQSNIDANT
jgi:hypothetical protein